MLGHLSKENNLPELAYEAVRMEITMGENPYRAEDFRMMLNYVSDRAICKVASARFTSLRDSLCS